MWERLKWLPSNKPELLRGYLSKQSTSTDRRVQPGSSSELWGRGAGGRGEGAAATQGNVGTQNSGLEGLASQVAPSKTLVPALRRSSLTWHFSASGNTSWERKAQSEEGKTHTSCAKTLIEHTACVPSLKSDIGSSLKLFTRRP